MTKIVKTRKTITTLEPNRDLELPAEHKIMVYRIGATAFLFMAMVIVFGI